MASSSAQKEADAALTSLQDTTQLPGLLRLATETRIQIFELLASDKLYTSIYGISQFEGMVWTSRKLFTIFPITQVCRRLRNEAIPVFYGNFVWIRDFCIPQVCYSKWLQTIDPYAFQSLKGVIFEKYQHRCRDGKFAFGVGIDMTFDRKEIKFTFATEREQLCRCALLAAQMAQLGMITETAALEIEGDRARAKEVVMRMIAKMETLSLE